MKRWLQYSLCFVLIALTCLHAGAADNNSGSDESPVRGAKPKQLNVTHAGEGPAWHAPSRNLYFVGDNRITRLDSNGTSHVVREPSGGANGLLFDREGRLVVCEAGNRRVTRTEPDGVVIVLADSFGGKKF